MKARIDAGSDIATIGAWDAQRDATPLTAAEQKHFPETLEADAAKGHLFLVRTGGDGGGPIDLYVDEAIPGEVRARLVPKSGEFLLALPSGRLVVDGAEYYRSARPQAAGANGSVAVPAGQYSVRCYVAKDEEETPESEEALTELVGSAELSYYDRVNRTGCIAGALILLLFPILSFPLGWKLALPITAVAHLGLFHVRDWLLRRNARYRRLNEVVPAFRIENQDPVLVLELRSVRDPEGLKGGTLSL
jgi:hypothetical protein